MADDGTSTAEPGWRFHLDAGHLCLDFANTQSWRRGPAPIERLRSYRDLVAWACQSRLIDDAAAGHLLAIALRHPRRASSVLARALALRALLDRIFTGLAQGRRPGRADLVALNKHLAASLGRVRIVESGGSFRQVDAASDDALDTMLPPVVRSASELLIAPALTDLRRCGGPDCGWLFIDTSRTRKRRWCAMRVCGNRAKVRAHYQRQSAVS
jgi:predicted RNA-binding Zn ribbon-like protein